MVSPLLAEGNGAGFARPLPARSVVAPGPELTRSRRTAHSLRAVMSTKWLLIGLPIAILTVLLQSAFWVPTYARQAEGNPGRLVTFVRATVGDLKHLNPVVSADYDALQLMTDNLFEGLVWADENNKIAPKLAERWDVTEDAFVAVLPERRLKGGGLATAPALIERIEAARKQGLLGGAESSIQSVDSVPAEKRDITETVLATNAKGKQEPVDVELTVSVPERVRLRLSKVEAQLFERLAEVLGKDYFASAGFEDRFTLKKPEQLGMIRSKLSSLLEVGEHNPILTFHLRPGVRWQDGVPLTADDVRFTYQACIDPKNASPYAGSFASIKSVEVLDELTARVTYKRLYSPAIIDWMQALVPKHLLDAPALARETERRQLSAQDREQMSLRTTSFNRNPVGSGPFRFVEWLPGQYIHLTRNEQYWGEKAEYRDLYYRAIPDYLTMELEFGAGAVDMYLAQPHQTERYRHDDHFQVVPANDGYLAYIAYNIRRPLFQDVRVRRALSMGLDVDAIIKYVMSGEAKRATGPYYSNTPYYDPDLKPLPYDPKGALELLGQAGWHKNAAGMLEKDGKVFEFTLVTNAGNLQRKAIMTIAQDSWRKLGIDVKIQDFEWTVFLEDFVDQLNFDAIVMAWGGGAINPDQYVNWHSSQTHKYEHNFTGYESAEADALIMKIRTTYDADEQIKLTRQLHRVIAADQPYTFVFERLTPYVFDKRLGVVRHDPDGTEHVDKLTTPPSGDTFHSFRSWRKFTSVPELVR
jgi:ABC-type transport system substrate-binding protein